jgi:hypothetical protein
MGVTRRALARNAQTEKPKAKQTAKKMTKITKRAEL